MKTLIAFYSYTGNTRLIAGKIKKQLNCDILEIKPKVAYSNNYQTVVGETEDNEISKKNA